MYKNRYKYLIISILLILLLISINITLIKFNLISQLNKSRIILIKKENISKNSNKNNDLNKSENIINSEGLNSKNINSEVINSKDINSLTINSENNNSQDSYSENVDSTNINSENINWKIIIPKINLEANIKNGTTQDILEKNVGHFETTSIFNGNVGLAAHNNSFFRNIKNLEIGDEIFYISRLGKRQYKVSEVKKIQETDWSKLNQTTENKITLITCVKNIPYLRLCVQAIEISN